MATNQLDALLEMKGQRPFVPFRIVTVTGEKYTVEGRFQFAVGQTRVMYVYPKSDRFIEFSESQIAGIELVENKPAA